MTPQIMAWVGFHLFIFAMLAVDLGLFNRESREISFKESLAWSGIWICLALTFGVGVFLIRGNEAGLNFLTGYLIELALSIDNLFVFLLIFSYFAVPPQYQHRALFWGIIGALVMRGVFILAGVALIKRFDWLLIVFGAFLVLTGVKLAFQGEVQIHPERNPVLRLMRKLMHITPDFEGHKFFVRRNGLLMATPLFVVLVLIDVMDLIFAVDSVPAVLAITLDPFIVYTSNIFAIMGLRSFYFALAGLSRLFHLLGYGLAVILIFIGSKMLAHEVLGEHYKLPTSYALGFVVVILAVSIIASILIPKRSEEEHADSVSE